MEFDNCGDPIFDKKIWIMHLVGCIIQKRTIYILFFLRPAVAIATLLLLLPLVSLIMIIPSVFASSAVVVVQDPSVQVAVLVMVFPAPLKIMINMSLFLYTVRTPIVHRATIFLQDFLVGLLMEFFLIQDP